MALSVEPMDGEILVGYDPATGIAGLVALMSEKGLIQPLPPLDPGKKAEFLRGLEEMGKGRRPRILARPHLDRLLRELAELGPLPLADAASLVFYLGKHGLGLPLEQRVEIVRALAGGKSVKIITPEYEHDPGTGRKLDLVVWDEFDPEPKPITPELRAALRRRLRITRWGIGHGRLWTHSSADDGGYLFSGFALDVSAYARFLFYCAWARYRKRRAKWRGPRNRLAYAVARIVTDACGAPEWYGRIGRAVAVAGGAK